MAKSEKKHAWPRGLQRKLSGKVTGKWKKSSVAQAVIAQAGIAKPGTAPAGASADGPGPGVLDRLFAVVESRRDADPTISHSARLLSRGVAKVAQKFGEEAVECLIEAVAGNRDAVVAESADVLYHLLVLWVSAGVNPADVWSELIRREGISGIAEKAARTKPMAIGGKPTTSKIP